MYRICTINKNMSSDYLADLPGLTNPITHAGRVVYNAQRDSIETHQRKIAGRRESGKSRFFPLENDEDLSIQPYELCLRNKKGLYVSHAPNDTDIHVFSSANGMFEYSKGTKENKKKRKRDNLDFAGVAANRAIYDPNNNANEAMLAVQVGGLQTMYNTGNGDIHAGDIVLWNLPDEDNRPRIPGVNRSKLLFATEAYKSSTASAAEKKAVADLKDDPEKLVATLKALHNDTQRRVIGKALSNAKPGKTFDILLGHYGV